MLCVSTVRQGALYRHHRGNPPGQTGVAEAQRVADFLVEIGAPRSALILETGSRNTRENAVNTAAIFKEQAGDTAFSSPRERGS